MKRTFLFFAGLLITMILHIDADAQAVDKATVVAELRQAIAPFSDSGYQHLSLTYRFSYQSKPQVVLDSLAAEYKTWKNKKWYSIDSTETLIDDSIKAVLYKEDKLIWLGKNTSGHDMLQSFLLLAASITGDTDAVCSRKVLPAGIQYTILFKKPAQCRELSFVVSAQGRLVGTRQVVDPRLMTDPETPVADAPGNDWAIIDVEVNRYADKEVNPADFKLGRWLQKHEAGWQPAAAYAGYRLFNASLK